jgi:CRP/FNR family transcriptional regulator, cyclic AMP receptor protein
LSERAYLVRQGDLVDAIWLVLEGRIKIESSSASGRSSQLGICGPGDWVGSYLRPLVYPTDVVSLEATTLARFATGDLPRLAASEPSVGAALAASFARQLESTIAKLDARSTLTAKGRICAELQRRSADSPTIHPAPVVAELARTAQTTRETASRTVTELERRGIIERTAGALRVISPRLLGDLVV